MAAGDDRPSSNLLRAVTGPWREPPGEDLSRILALTDGVFAFAMTLLVVNLTGLAFLSCGTPGNPASCTEAYLLQNLGQSATFFVGYATVFFVTAFYWTHHHRAFRYIERYDALLLWTNIVFLLFIAVQPFVLEVFNRFSETTAGVTLFASTSALLGLLLGAMWWHATGSGALVDPKLPASVRTYFRRRGFLIPGIFLATIPIGFVSPSIASYLWLAIFPAGVLIRRYGVA